MSIVLFIAGLIALVAGAEGLVRGASRLSLSWGISPLVVGLTIVAFGTSAPEMAVSVGAAASGTTDLAVGNVVGSNIFNVLFILGLAALIAPLAVHVQVIRQEVPIMLAAGLVLVVMALDSRISVAEAALLLALMVGYTVFLIVQARRAPPQEQSDFAPDVPTSRWDRHWSVQLLLVLAGLALLVLGSRWLVEAATAFATALGVSELIIGLTIVAAGTSLPEVAASVTASLRGQRDIAVGNVVGSNLFNILGCLGLAGVVAPGGLPIAESVLNFDLWVMMATLLACLPIFMTGREIARWEGGVLLAYYIAYVTYLILAAQHHAALAAYSTVMMSFVLPLTIVTLAVMVVHRKPH
ncbi:calcium/sodium antiporter [Caldimonas caldifontis]|uniref:Sodium:calcium antiporter n=1 Tax=Caldimonas caldifontis TaxID=1452508 RepID=A0A2S5SVK7_9BURK|nr:calcium/sodium antiporter [Caldimonas caldifontis]PPE66783.1 sodium:calcium antiporter [Caldimonas caldifontis]